MSDPIILTAWRGGTFGLRVRKADRCRFAGRREVVIVLPRIRQPSRQLTVDITPSFWRTCPEFRSADIGRWLTERRLCPWPFGQPPRFEATVSRLGEVVTIVRESTVSTGQVAAAELRERARAPRIRISASGRNIPTRGRGNADDLEHVRDRFVARPLSGRAASSTYPPKVGEVGSRRRCRLHDGLMRKGNK